MNIKDIFNNMEYGKAPESPDQALAWLASHKNKMSHFIDGSWQQGSGHFASNNPATGEELAQVAQGDEKTVNQAVKAAAKALPDWQDLSTFITTLAGHNCWTMKCQSMRPLVWWAR